MNTQNDCDCAEKTGVEPADKTEEPDQAGIETGPEEPIQNNRSELLKVMYAWVMSRL